MTRAVAFLGLAALAIAWPDGASADNPRATLVLHAITAAPSNHCFTPQDRGFDCSPFGPAVVSVAPSTEIDVYLYVRNHEDLVGVQCAFAWDDSWQFRFWSPGSLGGCQSQQIYGATPGPPGGATAGTVAAVFDCVTGGFLAPIGRMQMGAGSTGCLTIIDSSFPFGAHVVGCDLAVTPIDPANRGRICVGAGGVDACEPVNAVEPITWGRIKASYSRR